MAKRIIATRMHGFVHKPLSFALIKGRRYYDGLHRIIAYENIERRADAGFLLGQIGQPNILLEKGRRAATGYMADFLTVDGNRIMIAGDATADHFKAD